MTTGLPEPPRKLVLECPGCDGRVELERYVPDRRVRCSKCGLEMTVPIVEEYLTDRERRRFVGRVPSPVKPEVQARVEKPPPLGRLLGMTALLAAMVACGVVLLVLRASRPPDKAPEEAGERELTNAELQSRNARSEFPLWLGFEWAYAIAPDVAGGAAKEEGRKVVGQAGGPDDPPQFDVAIAHPSGGVVRALRVDRDGVLLAAESRGGERRTFMPPMPIVRLPLLVDDVWTYSGTATRDGGAEEAIELDFRVSVETVESGLGRHECYRVDMQGTRGGETVEETCWYARGMGLVRRVTKRGSAVEEAKLVRFKVE